MIDRADAAEAVAAAGRRELAEPRPEVLGLRGQIRLDLRPRSGERRGLGVGNQAACELFE